MNQEMVKLKDICRPKQWKTLSLKTLQKNGYPVYGANGRIGYTDSYTHEFPTLMITCRGATCGSVHISEPKSYINGNAMALDSLRPEFEKKFLYYYFQFRRFDDIISGSAQPQITRQGLEKILVPKVSLPTQKRIAEILERADALRKKDQELLKKYDELAQSIFIEMFGDPVKNDRGWEIHPFGERIISIRYGTGSPPKYTEIGIPFIRATNIKNGDIVNKDMVFISIEESKKIEKCFVNEGDLIIVRSGINTGDCGYITKEYDKCLAGYDLIVQINSDFSLFYHFLINSKWGQSIIKPLSRRAAQPHLNAEQVISFPFICPPINKIKVFNEILRKVNLLKSNTKKSKDLNILLYGSLLQKAFNGELD